MDFHLHLGCSTLLLPLLAAAVAIASPQHQRSFFRKRFVVVIFLELKNSVLRIITNYKQTQAEACHH